MSAEAEHERHDDGQREGDEEERNRQADVGHVDAAAHDHDQDVDGRGDHPQDGARGDEGGGPSRGRPSFMRTGATSGPVLRTAASDDPVIMPGNMTISMTVQSRATWRRWKVRRMAAVSAVQKARGLQDAS